MPNKRKRRSRVGYKASYARYASEGRLAKNKQKKALRHLNKHPNDKQSQEALK